MAARDSCYAGYISSYMEKKIEELSDGNIVNQQLPSLPSQKNLVTGILRFRMIRRTPDCGGMVKEFRRVPFALECLSYDLERAFHSQKGTVNGKNLTPDGALYFLTNNTDGRGSPRPNDDKIYRIVKKK